MSRVIVVTDSNSGITQSEAKELGVVVMPMPFYINGQMFYEDIDLTQEQFYQKLKEGGEIKTSMLLWLLMIMMERFRLSITSVFP